MNEEDRYEAIELIVKAREDGQSWFDVISDLISKDCESNDETSCTCGLESMGGCSGTLDQCYRQQGIAEDLVGPVDRADLELVLSYLDLENLSEEAKQAAKRLSDECTWWDDIEEFYSDEDDEEE